MDKQDKTYSFDDLERIIRRLTDEDGCPWDKAQSHESIRINLIEEAYEAVDAIDKKDRAAMIEELGDVLLQSVFHGDIARRRGEFTTDDIIDGLCKKLISRHTHIFGKNKAADAGEALGFWEAAKNTEKKHISPADSVRAYPDGFASMLKAQKIFNKLGKGISTEKLSSMLEDMDFSDETKAGKFLFLAAAYAARSGFDAETALNRYCSMVTRLAGISDLEQIIDKIDEDRKN